MRCHCLHDSNEIFIQGASQSTRNSRMGPRPSAQESPLQPEGTTALSPGEETLPVLARDHLMSRGQRATRKQRTMTRTASPMARNTSSDLTQPLARNGDEYIPLCSESICCTLGSASQGGLDDEQDSPCPCGFTVQPGVGVSNHCHTCTLLIFASYFRNFEKCRLSWCAVPLKQLSK